MKARGRCTATRLIGTTLLLLAVAKTTHDEDTQAVGYVAVPVDLPGVSTTVSVSLAPHGRVNRPQHVPLRV